MIISVAAVIHSGLGNNIEPTPSYPIMLQDMWMDYATTMLIQHIQQSNSISPAQLHRCMYGLPTNLNIAFWKDIVEGYHSVVVESI